MHFDSIRDAVIITFCKLVFQFSEHLLESAMKSTSISCNTLKVVSTTFVLVYFAYVKDTTCGRKIKFFYFISKAFFSWDNQILTFPVFKCHDVIKFLSLRHEIHTIE